eukprot:5573282-Pleurochrysis_carterae.AAC.12
MHSFPICTRPACVLVERSALRDPRSAHGHTRVTAPPTRSRVGAPSPRASAYFLAMTSSIVV